MRRLAAAAIMSLFPVAGAAQIALPGPVALPDTGSILGRGIAIPQLDGLSLGEAGKLLAQARLDRLADFLRQNRTAAEADRDGNPAVRGIVIATGITEAETAAAQKAGFALVSSEIIAGLDLKVVRFAVPSGQRLRDGLRKMAAIAPGAEVSADNLYFPAQSPRKPLRVAPAPSAPVARPRLGLIDSGVSAQAGLGSNVEQRGFAGGAPLGGDHGTAVASLMAGDGTIRGAAPGLGMLVADVYGSDPSGGSAAAIARALGWMAERRVPVVTMSLVGPDNALLKRAIAAAQGKGVLIVAAVGNDGPAAPPAFPASYYGVLAVTGVDARERLLPEAGRAAHVDFAAPGADLKAATVRGVERVRGTSFAAPFVAGRLGKLYPGADIGDIRAAVSHLAAEAIDLGKPGVDKLFGNGLICRNCATR